MFLNDTENFNESDSSRTQLREDDLTCIHFTSSFVTSRRLPFIPLMRQSICICGSNDVGKQLCQGVYTENETLKTPLPTSDSFTMNPNLDMTHTCGWADQLAKPNACQQPRYQEPAGAYLDVILDALPESCVSVSGQDIVLPWNMAVWVRSPLLPEEPVEEALIPLIVAVPISARIAALRHPGPRKKYWFLQLRFQKG